MDIQLIITICFALLAIAIVVVVKIRSIIKHPRRYTVDKCGGGLGNAHYHFKTTRNLKEIYEEYGIRSAYKVWLSRFPVEYRYGQLNKSLDTITK